jgi:hypothetical protein
MDPILVGRNRLLQFRTISALASFKTVRMPIRAIKPIYRNPHRPIDRKRVAEYHRLLSG